MLQAPLSRLPGDYASTSQRAPRKARNGIPDTNPLERLNGEIKRRTDVVGIFPNEAAMDVPTMLPILSGGPCCDATP